MLDIKYLSFDKIPCHAIYTAILGLLCKVLTMFKTY